MLDLKKRNKRAMLVGFILFAVFIWSAAYLICLKSDAYKKAIEFSSINKIVVSKLGNSLRFRLAFYGFRVSENVNYGSAEFTIIAAGDRMYGDIYFLLIKKRLTGRFKKRY